MWWRIALTAPGYAPGATEAEPRPWAELPMKRPRKAVDAPALLARETRLVPFVRQRWRLLLGYPAPYRVGMSSLGYLTLHRRVSARPQWSVERVFADPSDPSARLSSLETGAPVSDFHALGISVAHELELPAVANLLRGLGLNPRRRERRGAPLVVVGGPLTAINPRPLAALADLVIVGEADAAMDSLCDALVQGLSVDNGPAMLGPDAGCWWPDSGAPAPPPLRVGPELLPAHSALWSPDAELSDMFLVETGRGCNRACGFCATSREAAGRCRVVPAARVLATIPDEATRVGLVGAAVSDHPELREILTTLIDSEREVGLSSIRADRLDPSLVALLQRAGLRTLTLGVDGASARLRGLVKKGVTEAHLREAARLAQEAGLRRLKLYQLVGLPEETDEDLDEMVQLTLELSHTLPVTLAVSPFVPKPGTPLGSASQAPVKEVDRRLRYVRKKLQGRVRIQPASARWAWVEAHLARGDEATGEAVLRAWERGGKFAHFKAELNEAD